MQPSKPSTRTLAIFGLLVVGVVCSFAFHAALTDMSVTYTATAVQPGEDPSRVADASRHIVDLDERLRGKSVAVQRPIDRAATNGSFRGNVPPELDIILDDVEARYAVYETAREYFARGGYREHSPRSVVLVPFKRLFAVGALLFVAGPLQGAAVSGEVVLAILVVGKLLYDIAVTGCLADGGT